MISGGPAALSNAELLAVILRSGTRELGALDLAQTLYSSAGGSLVALSSFTLDRLMSIPGIKSSKALSLMASFELGRRMIMERGTGRVPLTGASGVYAYFRPRMKGLKHEECWVLFVNRSNFITGSLRMSQGCDDSTTIDNRTILREALIHHAGAIVLVHNHPSGNPLPGKADVEATASLKEAAEAMDILLLDHVIVCDDCYYSFCDEAVSNA